MDSELRRLVKSIESGAIRDPERVRAILDDARLLIDKKDTQLSRIKDLLFRAEQAFVRGWPIARI